MFYVSMLQKPEVRVVRIFSVLLIASRDVKPLSLSFFDESDALDCFFQYAKDSTYYPKLVRNDIYVTTGHPLFDHASNIISSSLDVQSRNYFANQLKK